MSTLELNKCIHILLKRGHHLTSRLDISIFRSVSMKKALITAIIFLSVNVSYGQEFIKISYKDSIKLTKVWLQFKNALQNKDINTLHKLSLKKVSCTIFDTTDAKGNYKNPIKEIDVFLSQFFYEMPKSKLWYVMKTEKYFFRVVNVNQGTKAKKSVLYEIWYNTIKPSKNWEGMQHQFGFAKVSGQLKFFGLGSIP